MSAPGADVDLRDITEPQREVITRRYGWGVSDEVFTVTAALRLKWDIMAVLYDVEEREQW